MSALRVRHQMMFTSFQFHLLLGSRRIPGSMLTVVVGTSACRYTQTRCLFSAASIRTTQQYAWMEDLCKYSTSTHFSSRRRIARRTGAITRFRRLLRLELVARKSSRYLSLARINSDNHPHSASGGATEISPSSWNNNNLSNIFSTAYTKPINTYYPYSLETTNSTKSGTETTSSGISMPPWVKAIIGVFTGLGCIALGLAAWYLYRRVQRRKQSVITATIMSSSVRKSSPDISSATEETNTNYSSLAMTPMTGVSSLSREKELETSNTQISVGTPMSQADSAPIFELDCEYIQPSCEFLNS